MSYSKKYLEPLAVLTMEPEVITPVVMRLVVIFSFLEKALEPLMRPVTELSLFLFQLDNFGTPGGADPAPARTLAAGMAMVADERDLKNGCDLSKGISVLGSRKYLDPLNVVTVAPGEAFPLTLEVVILDPFLKLAEPVMVAVIDPSGLNVHLESVATPVGATVAVFGDTVPPKAPPKREIVALGLAVVINCSAFFTFSSDCC